MEETTMRNFYAQYTREEKALARQLHHLHSSRQTVSYAHDRAQNAFMKRYSALLKRKNGGLLPARGKASPSENKSTLHVTGAGVGKSNNQHVTSNADNFDPFSTIKDVNGPNDGGRIPTKANHRTYSQSSVAVDEKVPEPRTRNWSAPVSRARITTVLPYIDGCPMQYKYLTDIVSFNNQLSRLGRQVAIGNYKKVRNAWEQDTDFSGTVATDFTESPCSHFAAEKSCVGQQSSTCRGILVNRTTYSGLSDGSIIVETGQSGTLGRNTLSAEFPGSLEHHGMKEKSGKPGTKKKVTFGEEEILGHEIETSSNLDDQPSTNIRRHINIVNL